MKKILLILALMTTAPGLNIIHARRRVPLPCVVINTFGEIASGAAHGLRLYRANSTNPVKIKDASCIAAILSGIMAISNFITIYYTNSFNPNFAKHFLEAFNAVEMYKKAEVISEQNRSNTLEQREINREFIGVLLAFLVLSRHFQAKYQFKISDSDFLGRPHPPEHVLANVGRFLLDMIYPTCEFFISYSKDKKEQ